MISRAFTEIDSAIHRLDPRGRLVAASALAIVLALTHRLDVAGAGLVLGLLLAATAGLPGRPLRRRLAWLNLVLGLLASSLLLTGQRELELGGGIMINQDGLDRAGLMLLKGNAIMLLGTALLSTIEAAQLGQALRQLGVPVKLSQLVFLTVRYADVLHEEYLRLRQALRARAFRMRLSRHSLRILGYLVGNLLVRSFDRAQRVLEAMRCRGFHGEFPSLTSRRWRRGDQCFLASAALLLLLFSWWEYR